MARGGRALRRNATAPAVGVSKPTQPRPIMKPPDICVTAPVPSEEEVLKAIASLYTDGLRPYSRILRKRLVEHAQEQAELLGEDGGNHVKDCDAGKLRSLCEASQYLRVEAEDGGEWSAVFLDREANFIDIYDPVDNYPQELWTAAEDYFKSLGDSSDLALAGGRYASSRALAQCRLPFLEGYSLGQVCHITQIAISQRKLLGYFNGAIVPYERSTSMLKCRCAQQQRPLVDPPTSVSPDGPTQFQVADLGTARLKLREILDSALLRGAEQVPLSNIKRLFRSLHQMELSETALGHCKLTELLQDPRFNDICTVQLQDRGYAVVPVYADRKTRLNNDGVALETNIPQVTPRIEEQELLKASNGTPQQQYDCVSQDLVQEQAEPPLARTPSPPRMLQRAFTTPDGFGVGKEPRNENVKSSDGVFSHQSLAGSKCSTASNINGKSGSVADMDSLRGLARMDSTLSEGGYGCPQRGAGEELRARLQRRLFKAEGRV